MNFTTPYNTNDYFFTKEQGYILFETPLFNTYFEMRVHISTYDFYTEQLKVTALLYKIPLFNNKASFLLGEIIDRSMPRMKGINLRSLFQYKAAAVELIIKEVDYASEMVINTNTIGPIKFISGYIPEVVQNNCAFLDLYNLPHRVTPAGYAFINMILTTGTHNFKVYKNDIEVDSFDITIISSNIVSRALSLSAYGAMQGDIISCRSIDKPTLSKSFYVFPATLYSNHIAFEDAFRLKTILEFTGEYKFNGDFIAKMNKIQKGPQEFSRKISSKTDVVLTINTGYVLQEDEVMIESLLASARAWLITGENQGIDLVPISKKISKQDPTTALYSYDIEFMVNPVNEKPLRIAMNQPLVIIERDDIAPSAPTNLIRLSATPTTVSLIWNASYDVSGVTGYDIYSNGVYLASSQGTTYTATGLLASTTYAFYVKAKDAAGNISNSSNVLTTATPAIQDLTPPTAPTNLVASNVTTNSLLLAWTASTDNVGVKHYNVFKSGIKIAETSNTYYEISGLFSSTPYSFKVTAQDFAGNISIDSNIANATTESQATFQFWFEGRWPEGDFHAPNGGFVTYIDTYGYTVTANGFFVGECSEIVAQQILNQSGVFTCTPN